MCLCVYVCMCACMYARIMSVCVCVNAVVLLSNEPTADEAGAMMKKPWLGKGTSSSDPR